MAYAGRGCYDDDEQSATPKRQFLLPRLHAHRQQVLDLNAMSVEDIAAAARATAAADPFAARLPEPPGVRRSRQAFITGPPT
jgi:hypothetical protein